MKFTHNKTDETINVNFAKAWAKYNACPECRFHSECNDWVNENGVKAINSCKGLGVIYIESETKGEDNEPDCACYGGDPVRNEDSDIDQEEFQIYPESGQMEVYLHNKETSECLVGTFKINNCPICGRKL